MYIQKFKYQLNTSNNIDHSHTDYIDQFLCVRGYSIKPLVPVKYLLSELRMLIKATGYALYKVVFRKYVNDTSCLK